MTTAELKQLATRIRRSVIVESYRANVGHIGSALCIADIVAVLFGAAMEREGSDRDRLILSKGHAALALYAALEARGAISADELASFCSDGTALGAHPEHVVSGIDFSTGSLGHGLSMCAGAALGARMSGSSRRAFVLMSDAELNEGSVWEAAMFAAQHQLGRLTAVLDANSQQALGYTKEILDLEPLAERWSAFGWDVEEIDGHDIAALEQSLTATTEPEAAPRIVIARTTFGKGVSYMESRIEWHYLPLSDEHYAQAIEELEIERTSVRTAHA